MVKKTSSPQRAALSKIIPKMVRIKSVSLDIVRLLLGGHNQAQVACMHDIKAANDHPRAPPQLLSRGPAVFGEKEETYMRARGIYEKGLKPLGI